MTKQDVLNKLHLMPHIEGHLKYPGGHIVTIDFICFGQKNPRELFFRYPQKWNIHEKNFIRQYMVYFANSPMIDHLVDHDTIVKLWKIKDPKKLFDRCIELGFNPF